jgi:hypothetical protein
MSSWSEISQKNLFPFSKEQSDFETALQEWAHTSVLVDHLFPIESWMVSLLGVAKIE